MTYGQGLDSCFRRRILRTVYFLFVDRFDLLIVIRALAFRRR